jgi:UDP:flavonoid glycosyltransferase YjiC (YdhE family)
LFAWELGRGLGHLVNIRRMAVRMKGHGVSTVAAVSNPLSAVLQGTCDDVIAAPPWPVTRQDASQRAAQSSATLNDILASAGLSDMAVVHDLLAEWDNIFTRVQPQLLVADFAPIAALAARGRIPLLQVGNGYTLPPDDMNRFPPLHRLSPPRWKEEDTLQAVNDAARSQGRKELERLPQLFSGDARLVQTFALLDPYDSQRVDPVDGPPIETAPIERRDDAATVFVYWSGGYDVPENICEIFAPFAKHTRIHASGLSAAQIGDLTRAGVQIDTELASLPEVLASSRLVIHSGGSGVACEALAAGVPQIIVSHQIEQTLNGAALERAGLGTLLETYNPSIRITSDLIAAAYTDGALSARAAEAGRWHRAWLSDKNPALRCEQICLQLLGE